MEVFFLFHFFELSNDSLVEEIGLKLLKAKSFDYETF